MAYRPRWRKVVAQIHLKIPPWILLKCTGNTLQWRQLHPKASKQGVEKWDILWKIMVPNATGDFVTKKGIICLITIPLSAVTTAVSVESKSALVDMLDIFGCPLFLIGTIMKTCALHARRSTSTTFCASCSCLPWQPFSGSVDWVSRTIWMDSAKSRSYAMWFIFVWPSQKWCLLIKVKNTRLSRTTNLR